MKSLISLLTLLISLLIPTLGSAGTRWIDGTPAIRVIGQADFVSNTGTNTVDRLRFPEDVAIDPVSGKVFVADTGNNRVLRFASYAALANGAAAEAVVGQSTFEATGGRNTQDGLFAPSGVYVDGQGRLWVSDKNNNRILRYDNAATLADGPPADGILGQTGYGVSSAATSQTRVFNPKGITGDAAGNLFVVDAIGTRVLMFADAANLPDSSPASLVLGQEDFTGSGIATQQDNFFSPTAIALDAAGNLYVADTENHRVMRFDAAATKSNGDDADAVFGQVNFNVAIAAAGTTGLSSPRGVAVDAEGRLWVADSGNGRLVAYENAATAGNGAAATLVLGRPDFTLDAAPEVSASRLDGPYGIEFDGGGRLHVCDRENSRVLFFSRSTLRPDLTIGAKIGSQKGGGVFNGSGTGQKQITVTTGKQVKFFAFVRNGGDVTDQYAVTSGKPDSRTDLKVFRVTGGRANVTAATRSGIHQTAALSAGAPSQYELQMKAKGKSAKANVTLKTFLQGRSVIDGTTDRVLAWIKNRP